MQIAVMIIWYFFVLLNAFYGGALTMFFTSVASIPFENIRDVIRAYPDWKLMMIKGNDVHYAFRALSGDPDYKAFWDRTKTDPAGSVFDTMEEGMKKLKEGQFVVHLGEGNLKARKNNLFATF